MLHLFLVNYSFNKEMQGVVMWHLNQMMKPVHDCA